MAIQASVTNNQITAEVVEGQVSVTVGGGVGPTGPQGPPGTSSLPAGTEGQVLTYVSGSWTAANPTGGVSNTDPRLSDAREWSADTISQAEAEAGTATTRRAFTALRVFQAIAAWWAGSAAKTKLDGIATGATANATDAQLRDRSTHTGTQAAGTITGLATVATSGAYSDLSGRPTLGTAAAAATSDFAAASHAHGNITNAGAIGTTSGQIVTTGTGGVLTTAASISSSLVSGLGTLATQNGTFSGTSSGTNTGDQTITLTGDVTGSGTGSFAVAISAGAVVTADLADGAVTYAKMQNVSATDRLLGRSTAGAGVIQEITCTAFGRSLIDDADATAARTTLGLATVASSGSANDLAGTLADARLSQSVQNTENVYTWASFR